MTIVNRCDYPVYFWSLEKWTKKKFTIISQYKDCKDNCGVTYKVSKSENLVGGQGGNKIQLKYATRKGKIWYDISFVDCARVTGYRQGDASRCPAWNEGLEVNGNIGGCKRMYCNKNEMCSHDAQGAYYIDYPVQK